MFRFQYKEYTVLFISIALLALIFFALLQWKKRTRRRIGDKKLVNALISNNSPGLFALKFILVGLAMAAGIMAVMNPRTAGADDSEKRKGIDVVIALDVSKSMLATDLAPNRLERAKQFVHKLMDAMPEDRFALVLFAGKAYLQMPLTVDHGSAKMFVTTASPDAVPQQGTEVSEALEMSTNGFNAKERRFKTIILITDGESHEEDAIEKAKELAEQGVMINTVGLGSPEGSPIPDALTGELKKDETGTVVISKLNEDELKQIAQFTNGVYVRLQTSEEAVSIMRTQMAQIERKAFDDISQMNFRTWYMWLAGAMFGLLFIENFIPERKKSRT